MTNTLNTGPTYTVRLHLDNDQGLHSEVRELVARELPRAERSAAHVRSMVADGLREWVGEALHERTRGHGDDPVRLLLQGLLQDVLREVDWLALADSYIEDVRDAEGVTA